MKKEINLAAMYAAYYGARVCAPTIEPDMDMWENARIITVEDKCILYQDEEGIAGININDCKLVLKPLSEISDEDAIEVAKMYGGLCIKVDKDGFLQVVYKNNVCVTYFVVNNPLNIPTKLTDFLRSRGYDCGYGSIKSLIESGYAIEENIHHQ